jgi:hypothetical protein
MPLGGFVRLRDAETGALARAYVSRGARTRYVRAVAEREAAVTEALRRTGARVGAVDEDAGPERALSRAFAL